MRTRLPTTAAALALAAGTLTATGTAQAQARTVLPEPGPAAETVADESLRERADGIMALTYTEFATTPHVAPFNWTSDGCSVPSAFTPYRKVFRPACDLHDFGYRNYGGNHELKLAPTLETKNWIDGRFREEMVRVCEDTYKTPLRRQSCFAAAEAYYQAVNKSPQGARAFGLLPSLAPGA